MRRASPILLLTLLLLAPLGMAEVGTDLERRVERLVASPTPLGPLLLAGDRAAWRVELPAQTVVLVEAQGARTSPFLLRAAREGAAESALALPTTHAGFVLSEPGAWRVSVDPLAGVAVDIRVSFRGRVGGENGAPSPFSLVDVNETTSCIVPGACLP